jgi:hypothetical protein
MDLPDEILLNIFKKIPSEQLLRFVPFVNRRFQRLVVQSGLIHDIAFYEFDTPDYINHVLDAFQHSVRSITLSTTNTFAIEQIKTIRKYNVPISKIVTDYPCRVGLETLCRP